MNVTELARKLRIRTDEMLEILPQFGFDIGKRAIKVDERVAQQIMHQWRNIKKELDKRKEEELKKKRELEKIARQEAGAEIAIPEVITVKNFSAKLGLTVTKVITELMKNGVLATQNENIDFDTASIIAQDLGFDVKKEGGEALSKNRKEDENKTAALIYAQENESQENLKPRPPVIVVMGHVDHGKTKLLDAIRKTDIVSGEAGGITQHIGAYQTVWKSPPTDMNPKGSAKALTFIDTPGHEAFSIMRSRGAKVADIAVLVVAADDSVKPQTIEALNIIRAAKLPYVVAINKIDKEGANIDKVRSDLALNGVTLEDWGGDVPSVQISAKNNLNIDKLLDMLILLADMNADKIRANPMRLAIGTIIESRVDKGEGPVATVLVQTGTLKRNDPLVVNNEIYGKVRAMKNSWNQIVDEAVPGAPVRVMGFKVAPQVGDILDVASIESAEKIDVKEKITEQRQAQKVYVKEQAGSDTAQEKEGKKYLPIVIKADVLGSLEAVLGSIEKFKHDEVEIKVIGKGLGNITEDDVKRADSGGIIYAFNVRPTAEAELLLAEKPQVKFFEFKIIYDLLNHMRDELEKMLITERISVSIGRLKVLKVFVRDKKFVTLGGVVEEGRAVTKAKAHIKNSPQGEILGEGIVESLQQGKNPADSIQSGSECGLKLKTEVEVKDGYVLEFYREEEKTRKIVFSKT